MRRNLKKNLILISIGLLLVSAGCESRRTYSLEEKVSQRITNTPKIQEICPSISDDGKKLVFEVDEKGNREIFMKNLETGKLINITNSPAQDHQPSISADGKKVVFLSDRTGTEEIHLVNLADIFYAKGTVERSKGLTDKAILDFEQAVDIDPLHIASLQELGRLYDQKQDYDKAVKQFDAIANYYSNELTKFLSENDTSIAQVKQQLEMLLKNNIISYNNLAFVYVHKGDRRAAADVRYSLGTHFEKIGLTRFAIDEFKKGLVDDPEPSFEIYSFLAKLYRNNNDHKNAAEMLEHALAIDPNSASAHNDLGMAYMELASLEDSKKVELSYVKKTFSEKAKKEFEKAIELSPNFTNAHQNLATYHYERGEYEEALKQWETIYQINPEYPGLKQNLLLVQGQFDDEEP